MKNELKINIYFDEDFRELNELVEKIIVSILKKENSYIC